MKKTLALAACVAIGGIFVTAKPASAAVYVVAHPDDDILLMGPNLINDIKGNYLTVIIVVTAGDAGNGSGTIPSGQTVNTAHSFNTGSTPYYRARLNARLNALSTWIPSTYARPWTMSAEAFKPYFYGKMTVVEKATLGNVIEYHLNLPDLFDQKYNQGAYTVLENLNNTAGNTSDMTVQDVTGTNTYNIHALRDVIRLIVQRNFPNTPNLVINYHEPQWRDANYNPVERKNASDHFDHTAAGKIVADAIAGVPAYYCMTESIYYGYSEGQRGVNYPGVVADQRSGYEALHQTLYSQGNVIPFYPGDNVSGGTWGTTKPYSTAVDGTMRQLGAMDGFHTNFYGKTYWYNIPSTGPCNLGSAGD